MFGKNDIVQPKHFQDMRARSLKVTSIFPTLQGEGPFAGRPAVFVRLTGCNLACSFCDTYFNRGDIMDFDGIFLHIFDQLKRRFEGHYALKQEPILLVLTGGEPMLQPNISRFLSESHRRQFFDTQVESNGIHYQHIPDETTLVLSPKVNERTGEYIVPCTRALHRAEVLKFVISADMEPYCNIPPFAKRWFDEFGPNVATNGRPRRIYVSPMNMYARQPSANEDANLVYRSESNERISFWTEGLLDHDRNRANHERAAEVAMNAGVRLTLQMHLYANLP